MNLGLAIFLSAIFLGCIWLYYITRDRWNWKKIFKWFSIIILTFGIILIGVIIYQKIIQSNVTSTTYSSDNYIIEERKEILKNFKREKLTTLDDFNLGDTQSKIKFYFGSPQKVYQNPNIWIYGKGYWANYILYFINQKVIFINDRHYSDLYFNKTEEIIMKWGEPIKKINFADDYKRLFIYSQYNLFFIFYRNTVTSYGIYLPEYEKEVEDLIISQKYFDKGKKTL